MGWRRLVFWMVLLGMGLLPLRGTARETESDPTQVIGAHKQVFRHGWNLVSFPLLEEGVLTRELFGTALEGNDNQALSDRVYGFNENIGNWDVAWLNQVG